MVRLSVLELPLSVAAVRSGVAGATGAAVSMVTLKAADATDVFPARSVCVAVILCTPSLRVLVVTDVLPPLATALPTTVAPSKRVTVKPEVAATVNVGVVLLVRLSVVELPLSLVAVKSGAPGAAGAVVSMVTLRAADVVLLPAASVALALMLCVPSLSVLLVMLQLPLPSAVVVPSTVLPSSNTTALLASAVPEKVGVVTLVLLSVLELPLSLAARRSGTETAGPVVSMVMLSAAEADETLPATSVALAVMLCVPAVRVLVVMPGLL